MSVLPQAASPSAKYWLGQAPTLQDAPGFEIVHAQRGAAVQAGALVEMSVDVDEALGVGAGIVRIGVDDAIGVGREGVSGDRDEGESAVDGGDAHSN